MAVTAFVLNCPLHRHWQTQETKRARTPLRRPRTPRCAATKLLVVDLQEVVRGSSSEQLKAFSERVEVDRNSSKDTTFVLFSSRSGYGASMQSIKDADLVEPDALATLDGTEIYQRYYTTPDPYWEQTVLQNWQPKPVMWVLEQFFSDEVEDIRREGAWVFGNCKAGKDIGDVCQRVWVKLEEMGIEARVNAGEQEGEIIVRGGAGSAAEVVGFCQMMMKIDESSTFVFGRDDFVSSLTRGKGNKGLCGRDTKETWEVLGDRVFVSKESGAKALLDGVVHHAVF